MGIGITLRNLFNKIFGKHKTSSGDKITKEIKKRAKELGITPEEYINITKNNGSIWDVNAAYSGYGTGVTATNDDTITSLRNNLKQRYADLGITGQSERPTFGILSQTLSNLQTQVEQSQQAEAHDVRQSTDEQYQDALENVRDVETSSDNQNKKAQNFFLNTSNRAEQENDAADNQLTQTERAAEQNNNNANQQLVSTRTTADTNNAEAMQQQENTVREADANNDTAQKDLSEAKQQADANNSQAQKTTAEAQDNKNSTAGTVTSSKTNLDNAKQKVAQLENSLRTSNEPTTEQQRQVTQAKKERDEAEAKLEEAQKKDKEAEQKVKEAQGNEEKVKAEGNTQVDAQTRQVEQVKTEGEKTVESAAKKTEQVQQQGEKDIKKANDQVTSVKKEGDNNVSQQEQQAENVRKDGEKQVKKAQEKVDSTKQDGEKQVQQAESQARQVKREGEEAQRRAEDENYHQPTYGVAQANNPAEASNHYGEYAKNKAMKKVLEQNPQATMADAQAQLKKDMQKIDAAKTKGAQKCFTSAPKAELEKAAADRYNQEVQSGKSTKVSDGTKVNLPDGDMNNNIPKQQTAGNCWAHSGITSLASTKEGENMLKEHIYRDPSRGVTAVHLQEAQNNGMGTNKTGIYTFTDKEIAEGARRFGTGDGDVTAYMLATEKYLRENPNEKRRGQNASDFNHSFRMYEIVSGTRAMYVTNSDYINMGISNFSAKNDNMLNYNTLYKGIQSGNVSGTIIVGSNQSAHALSIVGTSPNGNLLIQDPLNRGTLNQMFAFVDEYGVRVQPFSRTQSVNGAPTYELSRDMYEKYVRDGSLYRWA